MVAAIGSVAFAGWILGSERLQAGFLGGDITMKTNTSVALILAGAALGLLGTRSPRAEGLGRWLGAAVAALAVLTLSEHLFGWDLGIDQWFFSEAPGAPGTASPNRMGLPASLSFTLAGLSLLFMDRPTASGRQPSKALGLGVCLIALLPLMGYVFGSEELFGIAQYTGIALATAVGLFVLGIGLLFARPDVGLTRVFCNDDAGGAFARRLVGPALVVPVVLGWLERHGERRGWYASAFGDSLVVVAFVVVFTALIWMNASVVARAARARRRAEAGEHALAERITAIVENIAQGFFALDDACRFRYVNREGERLAGRPRAEVMGRALWDVFPDIVPGEFHDAARRARAGRVLVRMESADSARQRWLEHDLVAVDGGLTMLSWDVTERRRLLESERAARGEAERANRLKDEFLATLSHELRTPLNAIVGWVHLLKQNGDPQTLARAVEVIDRNAKAQSQLIGDILDVSRIISGKMRLGLRPVDLGDVVRAALDSIQPAAAARRIAVEATLEPGAGLLSGDPERLQQVVWNLLSNAVKFTPPGGSVRLRLARVDSHVELTVEDTGVGIKPEFLPHVFERFRQQEGSTTRTYQGLGLGLAIVRHLVELHGGTVNVESQGDGRGTTFQVSLPLNATPKPAEDAEGPPAEGSSLSAIAAPDLGGLRVLVVEDDEDARELLATLLRRLGAEVTTATSAREGLEQLVRFKPDVLLSDIEMPGEDGYGFIHKVRALPSESGGGVPAAALTAHASTADRMRVLLAGYQLHLPKPVQPEELAMVVASLSGRTGKPPAAP